MSYQLDPVLPMSEALRVVALAELDSARSALASANDRHTGVHSARKCFKRLRSLLLLARPGMPEPAYDKMSSTIARLGKGLAAARDARALLDAMKSLERNTEPGLGEGSISALRSWLMERCEAAERKLEKSSASEALQMLLELRPRLARLIVYPDDFTPLSKGLQTCYRDARSQYKAAFSSSNADELHDWRKDVQQHWRHMQLLVPCWPSELGERTQAARRLSQVLGDDHDISNLMLLVSTPTMSFGDPEDVSGFRKRCKKRLRMLRKEARLSGKSLFFEKPSPFAERIHTHWKAAAAGALKPVSPPRQENNVVAIGDAWAEFGPQAGRAGKG